MRVDYFCFFFQIESFTLFNNKSILEFLLEVLLITWKETFRIWVSHKFVCASCLSASTIASNGIAIMILRISVWLSTLMSALRNCLWSFVFTIFPIHNLFITFFVIPEVSIVKKCLNLKWNKTYLLSSVYYLDNNYSLPLLFSFGVEYLLTSLWEYLFSLPFIFWPDVSILLFPWDYLLAPNAYWYILVYGSLPSLSIALL